MLCSSLLSGSDCVCIMEVILLYVHVCLFKEEKVTLVKVTLLKKVHVREICYVQWCISNGCSCSCFVIIIQHYIDTLLLELEDLV